MFAESITKRISFGVIPSSKNESLNIAFGIDASFACHMGICITSIIMNNPNLNLHFHIICDQIDDFDLVKLKILAKTNNLKIDIYYVNNTVFENWPVLSQYPRSIYFRIIAPELIQDSVTLLYLDADMICLGDLSPLLKLELNEHVAGVVSDVSPSYTPEKIALHITSNYFNSGFLYINIENWHKSKIGEKLIRFFANNKISITLADQDALNVVLKNKVVFINKKWNFFKDKDYPGNKPTIIHFVARPKPWQIWYQNKNNEYMFYKKISFWSEVPLQKPKHYRDKRFCAKQHLKEKNYYLASIYYFDYIFSKIKRKLSRSFLC